MGMFKRPLGWQFPLSGSSNSPQCVWRIHDVREFSRVVRKINELCSCLTATWFLLRVCRCADFSARSVDFPHEKLRPRILATRKPLSLSRFRRFTTGLAMERHLLKTNDTHMTEACSPPMSQIMKSTKMTSMNMKPTPLKLRHSLVLLTLAAPFWCSTVVSPQAASPQDGDTT